MGKMEEKVDYSQHKLVIKYVNKSNNEEPTWAKEGDSGFDFRANFTTNEVKGNLTLKPFERALIPTGLYFELPNGYELQVRPRSGHSFKTGLMAILGTVDTGYRGEVKVIMINLSDKEVTIEHGERIAQGVIAPRVSGDFGQMVKLQSVEELSSSERGEGGFGSTGTK
jgi:dUTP pyrophosphatase